MVGDREGLQRGACEGSRISQRDAWVRRRDGREEVEARRGTAEGLGMVG